MQQIRITMQNVESFIHDLSVNKGITKLAIAEKLFPNNAHPYQALRYLETSKRDLKSNELTVLADLSGFEVSDIIKSIK